ncbi:MAG: hypothetical protein Q9169_007803 [Polycauliona sp. 2 TL-2023]
MVLLVCLQSVLASETANGKVETGRQEPSRSRGRVKWCFRLEGMSYVPLLHHPSKFPSRCKPSSLQQISNHSAGRSAVERWGFKRSTQTLYRLDLCGYLTSYAWLVSHHTVNRTRKICNARTAAAKAFRLRVPAGLHLQEGMSLRLLTVVERVIWLISNGPGENQVTEPYEGLRVVAFLRSFSTSCDYQLLCGIASAKGANHANIHRGWKSGGGPYFCGTDADGDGTESPQAHVRRGLTFSSSGSELLAAVLGPECGATIWVKNVGIYGTSVNNGIGKCIEAKLVDQEGGGAVDLNPAAWTALTDSPDGQVSVVWGYGSCASAGGSTTTASSGSGSQDSEDETPDPSADTAEKTQETTTDGQPKISEKVEEFSNNDSGSGDETSSSGGSCTVQANYQCGGKNFSGCSTCAKDLQCVPENECKLDFISLSPGSIKEH